MRIEFIIPGEAVGKARPRVCGGHAYTPEKTKMYEARVGWEYVRAAKKRGATGSLRPPLAVFIYAYHEPPKSWPKKRQSDARGKPWAGLPDADNICKAILDGLQGVAYDNDSAVTDVTVVKRYTEAGNDKAHVRVVIRDEEDIFV